MAEIDERNAEFWNELCGTQLARSLGITRQTSDDLARFDGAYLGFYPYLGRYLQRVAAPGRRVLEIGLGYGTVGQYLADQGVDYHGLDIADGPVRLMAERLRMRGSDPATVVQGNAHALPYDDAFFDAVVSIGVLHHTGDLPRGVAEVHRVLRPGGVALVMLYHRHSFRQLAQVRGRAFLAGLRRRGAPVEGEAVRAMYDADSTGAGAPHTDFTSVREARRLFSRFSDVRVRIENFDTYTLGRLVVPRERLLGNVAHVLGLDLYVVATK